MQNHMMFVCKKKKIWYKNIDICNSLKYYLVYLILQFFILSYICQLAFLEYNRIKDI